MSIRPISFASSEGVSAHPNAFAVDCALNQYQKPETAWFFKLQIVRPAALATPIIAADSSVDDARWQVRDDRLTATDRDIAAVGAPGSVSRSQEGKRFDGTVARVFYVLSAEQLALLFVGETLYARFWQGYNDGEAIQWGDPLTFAVRI